jgi:hypothetical protein
MFVYVHSIKEATKKLLIWASFKSHLKLKFLIAVPFEVDLGIHFTLTSVKFSLTLGCFPFT